MTKESSSAGRLLLWERTDGWGAEVASVELAPDGVRALGTQLGIEPVAYRLDYELDAAAGFIARRLDVRVSGEGWTRSLELTRDGGGTWRCESGEDGEVELPSPGGPVDGLGDAVDCDLGLSPLTNLMPIRRHRLHERPGEVDLVAAWVSAPDLAVHRYPQRYEHVRMDERGASVRFVDRGLFPGFQSALELDRDGLVIEYPELARRVESIRA
jgi:uncharacterized protein